MWVQSIKLLLIVLPMGHLQGPVKSMWQRKEFNDSPSLTPYKMDRSS